MGEYPDLTAPDGGVIPRPQPVGRWPWVVLILGAAIIALGGVLLSPDTDIEPAGTTGPAATQQVVP